MPTLTDFVSPEESLLVRWEGTHRDGDGTTDVAVGTTDRSLVFCSEAGRFGVLPREHVSAVESRPETRVEYDLEDYRLFVGAGVTLAAVTFLGAVLASSGLLALGWLSLTVAGLWLAEHGWTNREAYDGVRRLESEVERVVVRTDAGDRHEFRFPAGDRAGAQLSRFVRAE